MDGRTFARGMHTYFKAQSTLPTATLPSWLPPSSVRTFAEPHARRSGASILAIAPRARDANPAARSRGGTNAVVAPALLRGRALAFVSPFSASGDCAPGASASLRAVSDSSSESPKDASRTPAGLSARSLSASVLRVGGSASGFSAILPDGRLGSFA